ncbi:acetyl-CoA carboxylase biotin carboxyl carrier protein [Actinokineospora enzanensis]|uniref:acetyl-CoA carboxylase biotin carboxyl carrier protein n=1 Tax=Actinokineospora enzanensis TaxID=155975 RepID=UPI0003814239|nr:biotin/lipoyl-containing protein [Actinokineospora enzanensis]
MTEDLYRPGLRRADLEAGGPMDPFTRDAGVELIDPVDLGSLLREAIGAATDLLGRDGRPPTSLSVRAGAVAIDLSWREPASRGHRVDAPAPVVPVVETAPVAPAGHVVTAPTVGVFYRSPSPGAEPFVSAGVTVSAGQQIGIVEAMKLMIPVEADRAGTVAEILVGDGDPVEFATPLLVLDPH